MSKYMNTKEVASKLNIAQSTVTYYIRQKQLNAIKLGKGYKISESDLQEFINNRQTKNESEV